MNLRFKKGAPWFRARAHSCVDKYLRAESSGRYSATLVGKWHLGVLPKFCPLQSRYDHFYGFRDLAYLLDRAELRGITAVVGRAQMGKSWLLKEVARRLSTPPNQRLVGFTEAAEPTDLFRQAGADLYSR